MWNEITSQEKIQEFLEYINHFHDSCIKELKYISGAYVTERRSMYPVNDRRTLNVLIQSQYAGCSMVELEYRGLKHLRLFPADERYTCEILDSTLVLYNGDIYWTDSGDVSMEELDDYEGTVVCATELRWRPIEGYLGNRELYRSVF